jgi:putative phosphoserine phosphatase/1-acylglycerol-3-phosphate O-acyltransferase
MSAPDLQRRVPRAGAFFDMDKTLIAENSASLYVRYRYQRGEITGLELLQGLGAYLRYKAGILDIHGWTKKTLLQFKGQSEKQLEDESRRWFDDIVAHTVYPEAERLVREHQARGHVVAIVSGATKFVVRPIAQRLGIEHFLYTRLEVEDGRFTGRVVEPICFEEGKIYWLQQFIEEQDIDLAKSYFYTDSITDLALLELVAHPVATNPDPRLYRTAIRRHWPIRFFEPPDVDLTRQAPRGTDRTRARSVSGSSAGRAESR